MHNAYFKVFIGGLEIVERDDIYRRLSSHGLTETSSLIPRSTFYRHKKLLEDAGLSSADMKAGAIVPLRKTQLVLAEPGNSWANWDVHDFE